MSHSYISIMIHYVFSTKRRIKIIVPELENRLFPYIGGIARENKMKALAIGGTEDHIHLLLSLPSTLSIAKAVQLIKETVTTSFDPTVELHMRLGVDPRHADQQVRDVVVLPHGLGKTVRVLVFAEGEDAQLAQESGADIIADAEIIV